MKHSRKSKTIAMQRDYLIWYAYRGMGVEIKDIPEIFNCTRQTVYNVLKKQR